MVRKDSGVVLKTGRSGETSRLVTFLGRESGKVRLLGKGALGSKSPLRGALEAGNRIEVIYYYKEGRTLYFVKEVHVVDTLRTGAASLDGVAANLAALELVDGVCYWGSPEARIVDLTEGYLGCRDAEDPLAVYLAFELRLLEILGTLPQLDTCAECGAPTAGGFYYPADGNSRCRTHGVTAPQRVKVDRELVDLAAFMIGSTFEEVRTTSVDAASRKRLGKLLHWTYTFHVQGYSLPKSLSLISRTRHH